jgi:hypothetical protein
MDEIRVRTVVGLAWNGSCSEPDLAICKLKTGPGLAVFCEGAGMDETGTDDEWMRHGCKEGQA